MCCPIIGITTNTSFYSFKNIDSKYSIGNNSEYCNCIERVGGIPLFLPISTQESTLLHFVSLCDGFLFAGGDDITSSLYGEEPHALLGQTCPTTDRSHLTLIQLVLASKKPILAICRGMQLLNIACGGNVYQDLSEYPSPPLQHSQFAPRAQATHSVTTTPHSLLATLLGDTFLTNTFHHQAIHQLGHSVVATAFTKDGVIEGIELTDYPFAIGVQWHPEVMLSCSPSMLPLFADFIHHTHP